MEKRKAPSHIRVRGAGVHNLKNVDVDIPLNRIVGEIVRKLKRAREHRISFELTADVPNAETIEAIQEARKMKAPLAWAIPIPTWIR